MSIQTLTGSDTFVIFDTVLTGLADGDAVTITFSDDLMAVKTGKNGNTIYSQNESGNNADVVLRLMRGCTDDRMFQAKLAEMLQDIASFRLAEASYVKRLGDGQGEVLSDVYTLKGGVFMRKVDAKESTSGDTEEGISIYTMKFANITRSTQ